MTIRKALSEGNNHIICENGLEFDVKPAKDGGYILHHIEKNGRRQAKNRLKMTETDTETWIKKKCGRITEVGPGKYEKFIPGSEDLVDDRKAQKGKQAVGGYEFEEDDNKEEMLNRFLEKVSIDEDPDKEERSPEAPITHEEEPLINIGNDEEEKEMPDLSRPSNNYTERANNQQMQETQTMPNLQQYSYEQGSANYSQGQYGDQYSGYQRQEKSSIIYEDMAIKGDIETQGSVEVYGSLNGNINAQGNVMVTGMIKGNVSAMDMSITGTNGAEITGDIVGNAIQINAGSVIVGSIKANDLVIEGAVQGDIDVGGRVVIKSSSIIKGNISSQRIVIEDGAVIDGHCVQSYAEVTAESFFGNYVSKFTNRPLNPEDYKKEKEKAKKVKAEKAKAVAEAIENGDDSAINDATFNGYGGMSNLISGK